jgi:hypothetical protein
VSRRTRCTPLYRLEGCDLLRLMIVKQSEVLLLQARNWLTRCIRPYNIENDVVRGSTRALPSLRRTRNQLYRWSGGGGWGWDCPDVPVDGSASCASKGRAIDRRNTPKQHAFVIQI